MIRYGCVNYADLQAASRGKGSSRRTKKVVHKSASTEDAKLKLSLQKVGCQPIDGISEANLLPHRWKCSPLHEVSESVLYVQFIRSLDQPQLQYHCYLWKAGGEECE